MTRAGGSTRRAAARRTTTSGGLPSGRRGRSRSSWTPVWSAGVSRWPLGAVECDAIEIASASHCRVTRGNRASLARSVRRAASSTTSYSPGVSQLDLLARSARQIDVPPAVALADPGELSPSASQSARRGRPPRRRPFGQDRVDAGPCRHRPAYSVCVLQAIQLLQQDLVV